MSHNKAAAYLRSRLAVKDIDCDSGYKDIAIVTKASPHAVLKTLIIDGRFQ